VEDPGGAWLGLALARRDEACADAAILNAMWVAPEARGSRAVVLLCDACAAWAAARGLGALTLDVLAGNARARRAYESAGFTVTGDDTGDLVMTRLL